MAPMSTCNWSSNDKSVQKVYILKKKKKRGVWEFTLKEEEGEENWIQANVFLVDLTGFCIRLLNLSSAKKGKP